MRRLVVSLFILVVIVAVLGGLLVIGDTVAEHLTESAVASRIEKQIPGSHATVSISSQPYLVHLAASGEVEQLDAHVTGVTEDHYSFSSIDVVARNIKVNRSDLFTGSVHLQSIKNATITAVLSESELVQAGVVSSLKELGDLGSKSKATVTTNNSEVTVKLDGATFTIPLSTLVPCVGDAQFDGTNLVLTCVTTEIPPALQGKSS